MTIKEAHKLKAGAIVRESWSTSSDAIHGIVIDKKFETGAKREPQLCQLKESRYIVTVAWFKPRPSYRSADRTEETVSKISSYGLMLVSHAK